MPSKDPAHRKATLEAWHARYKAEHGHSYEQRPDRKLQKRQYYTKHKERYNQRQRERRARYPDIQRWTNLKRLYGITEQMYLLLAIAQNYCCAICKKPTASTYLYVDHCHRTNKIRGLLCLKCNSVLGMAGDDLTILNSAVEYLRTYDS